MVFSRKTFDKCTNGVPLKILKHKNKKTTLLAIVGLNPKTVIAPPTMTTLDH